MATLLLRASQDAPPTLGNMAMNLEPQASHEPCSVLLPGGILQVSHDHQDVETTGPP